MTGGPVGQAASRLFDVLGLRVEGGAEGMILTSGGRFAGYGFYLLEGKPVFVWNMLDLERLKWEGPDALAPGKHTVEFDFKYEGLGVGTLKYNNMSGLAQPGTGTPLTVTGSLPRGEHLDSGRSPPGGSLKSPQQPLSSREKQCCEAANFKQEV